MTGEGLGATGDSLRPSFRAQARNLCHSRSNGQCQEMLKREACDLRPSGIALFILRGASYLRRMSTTLCIKKPYEIRFCDLISVSLVSFLAGGGKSDPPPALSALLSYRYVHVGVWRSFRLPGGFASLHKILSWKFWTLHGFG